MAWTAGLVGAGLVYWFVWVMGAAEVKGKRAVDLKMGSITRDKVQDKYTQYWSFFRRPKETATTQASADKVNRARAHNRKAGLDAQCEVVCGNFMAMPFDDASFDGAYSIEATCHAPRLQDVYGEVYRVLMPGRLYVSYEWVTTPLYRADDPAHVEAIHGIERGDALPGLRRQDEIASIAQEVGFEVVQELDLALPPSLPWWTRLKMGRLAYWRNSLVVRVLTLLRIAPKGVVEVHEMLYETAQHLTLGGETGIFSPMHMVVLRKPVADAAE
ncbi:unnamed protein product [Triticum turgidum subsp. durum]|uniref:Methyltransferase n=1 Tax=Triticum turgidum subsp. durum TaxID=4567 RepID=A0A9R0U518_TRITD|nr:unnamed protein product [Triticum turgidum subsp. durum]